MKLYGLLIAKNESDIIEQTMLSIRQYGCFDGIFFYDNGSTDHTFQTVSKFNDLVLHAAVESESYSDNLKYKLLYKHADLYQEGDWLAILDADELYAENIAPLIEIATNANANYIETKSAQFYMTEQDDVTFFDPDRPAIEQRPHYLVNYGEPRLFRYTAAQPLTDQMVKSRHASMRMASAKLLVNHFQYRSAQQLQTRIDVRQANNKTSGNWGHVSQTRWQDYVVPSRLLHQFRGEFQYGLPAGVNLYKTRTNTAYTSGTLRWLEKNAYLTPSEADFLTASKLKKLAYRFL
jgi:glycosyltransferase involved in cell wall biosynthesis